MSRRGKKIFKKFDNIPDLDDRAAPDDEDEAGALGLNPTKIKPRLLFPSVEDQVDAIENILDAIQEEQEDDGQETEADSEAETDIDEPASQSSSIVIKKSHGKKPARAITPESEGEIEVKMSSFKARLAASGSASTRKKAPSSRALFDEGEDDDDPFGASTTPSGKSKAKKVAITSLDGFSSNEEEEVEAVVGARSGRGIKRALGSVLDTPQSAPRKKTRRGAVF